MLNDDGVKPEKPGTKILCYQFVMKNRCMPKQTKLKL